MSDHALLRRVSGDAAQGDVLDRFLDYVSEKKVDLYPAQEEAILSLYSDKNVILNTPTGSGKSLVATALHFRSIVAGGKSYYTCPIKALVNEKFLALCQEFGPDNVGMVTGDATVNRDAPIICCTAEILSNIALHEGSKASAHQVIMDEFHYYSDRERGVAWQVPLLTLPQAQFLLMSATLGDTTFFEKELTRLTGRETVLVSSKDRPVPLEFTYQEFSLGKTIEDLVTGGRSPVYLVNFTQRECAEQAQNLMSVDFCTKDEKRQIADAIEKSGIAFTSPYGKDVLRYIKHGVGIHHAGLLPKYRVLVEKLAQRGLLKIISGTDTLGVGVNVPIRTVLFTKLCKFDGQKTTILSVRDFQQIAGRAGRKGYDDRGYVVVMAPEHVIENLEMDRKAAADPKKAKKMVKKKPPEKGFVNWNKEMMEKLRDSPPEALVSRFNVSHGMLLNVLSRGNIDPEADECRAMATLIRDSHESDANKKKLRKTAFQLFRSLVDRKIVELEPELRVNVDLQEDFSLNHALSLYLIDTIALLERDHPEYSLDLLTLVESILENPELILRRQLDRIKTIRMDEMKMEGMDYDQRIEELEKLEYPKPRREFVYETFNQFAEKHPWVGQENIRPKSIAREMFENFYSFPEYIREYDLHRIEGLLLRYLSETYKVLAQTVPDAAKTEEVDSMVDYFGEMIRGIDSSLLDEWEKMRDPNWVKEETGDAAPAEQGPPDITRSKKAFTVMVRNEVFRVVRAIATRDYEGAAEILRSHGDDRYWEELESMIKPYYEDHQRICLDFKARIPKNTVISPVEGSRAWKVQQILTDPDEHNDWVAEFEVDLEKSREAAKPILKLLRVGAIGE